MAPLLLHGCAGLIGGIAGASGAQRAIKNIRKNVCPKYPTDPYCEIKEGTQIRVNKKYCVTHQEWADEMQKAYKKCKRPLAAPGSHALTKEEYNNSLSPERRAYCKSRKMQFGLHGKKTTAYRVKWQTTIGKVFKKEGILLDDNHKCSKSTGLDVTL